MKSQKGLTACFFWARQKRATRLGFAKISIFRKIEQKFQLLAGVEKKRRKSRIFAQSLPGLNSAKHCLFSRVSVQTPLKFAKSPILSREKAISAPSTRPGAQTRCPFGEILRPKFLKFLKNFQIAAPSAKCCVTRKFSYENFREFLSGGDWHTISRISRIRNSRNSRKFSERLLAPKFSKIFLRKIFENLKIRRGTGF